MLLQSVEEAVNVVKDSVVLNVLQTVSVARINALKMAISGRHFSDTQVSGWGEVALVPIYSGLMTKGVAISVLVGVSHSIDPKTVRVLISFLHGHVKQRLLALSRF